MEWTAEAARTEKMRNAHRIFVRKPDGKIYYGAWQVIGNIIRKLDVRAWTGSIWLLFEQVSGSCGL